MREASEQCQKHTSEARFIAARDDRYADGDVAEQKAAPTHVGARLHQLTSCPTLFNCSVIFTHDTSVEQESTISPVQKMRKRCSFWLMLAQKIS